MDSIRIKVLDGVYDPAEDSFLLRDVLLRYKGSLLEIGTGSGFVALSYAKNKNYYVEGTDINEKAIENAKLNAKLNNLNVKFYVSNMFENVNKTFDLIAFNPPYLPNDIEVKGSERFNDNGSIDIFIEEAKDYLKKDGKAFLLLSSLTPRLKQRLEKIETLYNDIKIEKEEALFFEKIFVISFR